MPRLATEHDGIGLQVLELRVLVLDAVLGHLGLVHEIEDHEQSVRVTVRDGMTTATVEGRLVAADLDRAGVDGHATDRDASAVSEELTVLIVDAAKQRLETMHHVPPDATPTVSAGPRR